MSLLQETLSSLYRKLGLENELFSHSSSDIPTLARELLGRLGHEGARALAQQLINNSENNEEKA